MNYRLKMEYRLDIGWRVQDNIARFIIIWRRLLLGFFSKIKINIHVFFIVDNKAE